MSLEKKIRQQKRGVCWALFVNPKQIRTMLHSSHVPSLSQEVTVGFPEEILTYPGGSGNVDGTDVGF